MAGKSYFKIFIGYYTFLNDFWNKYLAALYVRIQNKLYDNATYFLKMILFRCFCFKNDKIVIET